MRSSNGVWRSLVARAVWGRKVGGSSPLTPTGLGGGRALYPIAPRVFRDRAARAPDRSHDVAVGTDQLAFRELLEDGRAPVGTNHRADLVHLDVFGQVIPMHQPGRERFPTICAGLTFLQRVHPGARVVAPRATARKACCLPALRVVPAVVGTPAVAAVRELASPRAMELGSSFHLPAHRTGSKHFTRLGQR